ncbi:MAG: aminoacetone oxidase family FAD-binding enzyme [Lactobacillales bacterium]|jgi:predicted Rossmann fold flavoprotein|nr:aminoacetone oxidase family FAD-binding enzyme [Lactobacillales bacterium]
MYDLIVVGAGPAGLMSALVASEYGFKVLVLEKNERLGEKMRLSGGGRCNISNDLEPEAFLKNLTRGSKFLLSAFSTFDNLTLNDYLEQHGLSLKAEDHNRLFPVGENANEVVSWFENQLAGNDVEIRTNSDVEKLLVDGADVKGVSVNGEEIYAKKVFLACGSNAYPQTGSNGSGYRLVKPLGHKTTDLMSAVAPLYYAKKFRPVDLLKGLDLNDVPIKVISENKTVFEIKHDLLFTHFGLSGPGPMACALAINEHEHARIRLDLSEIYPLDFVVAGRIKINKVLTAVMPQRMAWAVLNLANVDESLKIADMYKEDFEAIERVMHGFEIPIGGTFSIDKSFVIGGGIALDEIKPKSFESKKVKNLHILGETLDLSGFTGGYNIAIAMISGYIAATSLIY